ncbi:kinase domain-containing protein [Xylariales sp. AK1849]|nr:kinase domain-containing protein [Xylariales sp. AK1849]
MWWGTAQIETTVTRQFVSSHLPLEEVNRLDQAPGFGDGLTDGTYWEWIEGKAKRIFLVLVELDIPGQIFGVVDNSWDDEDLPIAADQVERLTATRDGKFNKRFYDRQFHYILRYLEKDGHEAFDDDEVVPLEIVERRPVAGLNHNHAVDKVVLPNRPGEVFSRRRIPVGLDHGAVSNDDFLYEISSTRTIQHNHIVSYFASYTHLGYGFVLFGPASDYNLKSVLTGTTAPAPLKALDKQDRRLHTMNWVHCLADALCYLHSRGRSHGNIKPSTILFDSGNRVLFTDLSRLSAENLANSSDRAAFNKESYDYAAPEQWYRPMTGPSLYRKTAVTSPTSSTFGNYTFSISRAENPASTLHTPTPKLDPQPADIFSFGCVILELLSLQMKRQARTFASHRAAKHKSAGRGGAVLDSSFHKNIGQVESWMAALAKDAIKKDDEPIFRGIAPMLQIVARMLSASPQDRPTAREVEQQMYKVLTEHCLISEPHCVHQYVALEFGLSNLQLGNESGTFTISTRRHSGSSTSSEHRLSDGSGRSPQSPRNSGFQAIQNIRTPKLRTWDGPVYAGKTQLSD